MLPWGEGATLSEELTLEALGSHGGVPRILLAIQVFDQGDGMKKTEIYPMTIKRNWRVNIHRKLMIFSILMLRVSCGV